MTFPVVKAAGYILVHAPNIMMEHGTTITMERKNHPDSDYLKNTESQKPDNNEFQSEYSLFDKVRVIIETILFGWTVPAKSKKQRRLEED